MARTGQNLHHLLPSGEQQQASVETVCQHSMPRTTSLLVAHTGQSCSHCRQQNSPARSVAGANYMMILPGRRCYHVPSGASVCCRHPDDGASGFARSL
eukprot:6201145-Pleurochrysis_carterae.AAC.3